MAEKKTEEPEHTAPVFVFYIYTEYGQKPIMSFWYGLVCEIRNLISTGSQN